MTDSVKEAALKPCPFCSGKAASPQYYGDVNWDENGNRISHGRFIECTDCGANIWRKAGVPDDVLIAAWNRRSTS